MKDRVFRPGIALLLLLAVLFTLAPVWAQDPPAVKELLERAQTKSQTEAVESLIRKLKGGDSRPSAPAAKTAEPAAPAAAKVDVAPAPSAPPPPPAIASEPAPQPPSHAGPAPTHDPAPPPIAVAPTPSEPAAQPAAVSPADTGPPTPAVAMTKDEQPPPQAAPAAAAPLAIEVAKSPPSVDLEVHFDYKSAAITPQALDLLTTLGRALVDKRLAGQTFLIAGHTDARGGDAFNMKLSLARAEAVRAFLIRHFSIAPEQLRTEGRGFRQLKNARNPYAGENRRVQVTNITPQTARP